MISITLELIKKSIGLDLKLCDHFTGIKEFSNQRYFNVILNNKISESHDFNMLKNFSEKYNLIKVEPNGLKRVAIFYKQSI